MSEGDSMGMLIIGCVLLGAVGLGVLWGLASVAWMILGNSIAPRFLYPLETKLLQWLQDRSTARMYGTTIDVVRIRRKADTGAD